MIKPIHLAAALLLTGATAAHAQITNPDDLVARPPKPPTIARTSKADNLQWLWGFTQPKPTGRASDLRTDARFLALLRDNFKQPQAAFGDHQALRDAIPVLVMQYGAVTAESNRYITLDGCAPRFCPDHGMLWADLGSNDPLLIFAASVWSSEAHATDETSAPYDLWLFSNKPIDPDALPQALARSLRHWDERLAAAHRAVPHVAAAVLVEPDGTPRRISHPELIGANSLPPQPDTVTPKDPDDQ